MLYARPITVIDRKDALRERGEQAIPEFRKRTVARHSDVLDSWGRGHLSMWYSGLGMAFEKGRAEDVYWLIPGDFNYGTGWARKCWAACTICRRFASNCNRMPSHRRDRDRSQ
jgi:hypothetical protein